MTDDLAGGLGQVLDGDTWAAAQYLPGNAVDTIDGEGDDGPGKKKKPAATTIPATDRVLTGDEWAAAQRKSAEAVQATKVPALPTFAPRDVTKTPNDPRTKGTPLAPFDIHDPTTYANPILKNIVNPALENPPAAVAMGLAPLAGGPIALGAGTYFAGQTLIDFARYGYQKFVERDLSDDARRELEADPDRVTGEAAATQAVLVGLGAFIHVGVKGYGRLTDFGNGMVESGVRGLDDLHTTQEASPYRVAASEYAARRLAEDQQDLATERKTTAAELAGDVPDQPAAPFARTSRADAYRTAAEEYAGRRLAEDQADLADERRAEADRVAAASEIRRRPGGARPFFESEHGAEVLGTMAARHGMPEDASPYVPGSSNDVAWKSGHAAATESFPQQRVTYEYEQFGNSVRVDFPDQAAADAYARLNPRDAANWRKVSGPGPATESFPEGFSMGGALTDNRIPGASEIPATARGFNPAAGFEPTALPEGVTPETAALASALKPSRFRGHTTDDLLEAALDARERLDKAQQDEFHYSEGQLGTEEHQARVENNQEAEVYYAKSRALETERAKSQLAQIERELALRGLSGDKLAERISDAQDARMERQAMQEEDTLARIMGDEPPRRPSGAAPVDDPFGDASSPAQPGGPATSSPIEGTGDLRTRGLASAIERSALANKLATSLGDLPQYRQVSMADQAARASELLARDPALAKRIALGETPAPPDLLPESVLVAVERKATAEGDVATLDDLSKSRLGEQITHAGQRIRALGERDPESPVGAIQRVEDLRGDAAGKEVPRAAKELVADLKAKLSGGGVSAEKLAEFLKSLEC